MPKKVERTEVCGALLTWGADSFCAMDILSGGSSRLTYSQFREAMMAGDLIVSEPTIKSKWKMLAANGSIASGKDRGVVYWDSIKIYCRPELVASVERHIEQEKNKNKKTHTEGAVA